MRTFLFAFLLVPFLASQPPQPGAPHPPDDPMRELLFLPELIMENQQAIGLTDEQRDALRNEIRQASRQFTDMQWALQDEMERLLTLLKQPKVDEKLAAAQLDKVLSAEREIKRAQFMLLVRMRNKLNPEQQAKLREKQKPEVRGKED
jgi:Spy/CpxP family protein refolding chaperone